MLLNIHFLSVIFFKHNSSRNFTFQRFTGAKQRNIKSTNLFFKQSKRNTVTKKHLKISDYFKDQISPKVVSFLRGTYCYKNKLDFKGQPLTIL